LIWASEEAPPANPRWVFVLLQVTGKGVNLKLPRHWDENHHQQFQFGAVCGNDLVVLAKKKNLEVVTGRIYVYLHQQLSV
jgi:hypothetical protein